MKFKEFLNESEELKTKINAILDDMSSEEIDEFGLYLADSFLDDLPEEEYEDTFTKEEVQEMIELLGVNFYDEILDELDEISDSDENDEELDEAVSRIIKNSSLNKKKRKFMSTSKAQLRRTKVKRKQDARKNKSKKKRYYKANKVKLAAYQKSRATAIKKGKHNVKKRRAT